jgi:hypothetical protein
MLFYYFGYVIQFSIKVLSANIFKNRRLQNRSEINVNNLNNISNEASRYFRIEMTKLMSLRQTVRAGTFRDLYRGIKEFKRDYQLISNLNFWRLNVF